MMAKDIAKSDFQYVHVLFSFPEDVCGQEKTHERYDSTQHFKRSEQTYESGF